MSEKPEKYGSFFILSEHSKRVHDEYRKPGAANPIKYTW
jgi:hypothetical protein